MITSDSNPLNEFETTNENDCDDIIRSYLKFISLHPTMDSTNWIINTSSTDNTILNVLYDLIEQIVISVPTQHTTSPEHCLSVFKSNKVLAAILVLSNYFHGSGSNSIHGRSASPLFLRGYDLSGIAALLASLIKRAYSAPKATINAFNDEIHRIPGINTNILKEIHNIYNIFTPPQTPSSLSSISSSATSSLSSSLSPIKVLSPQQTPTSPTLSSIKVRKRRNSGRYLLWEKPPASFSPYVNTLKLSYLSTTSSSTTSPSVTPFELQQHDDTIHDITEESVAEKEKSEYDVFNSYRNKDSFLGCLCIRILLILKGFFSDFRTVNSCISDYKKSGSPSISAIDPLLDVLFLSPEHGDSGLQLVHLEVLSALESFFVTASLSRPLLDLLSTMHIIERLTDVIKRQEVCAVVCSSTVALLAQLLCTSSRLTNSLVRVFRSHGGYDVFHSAFVAELARTRGGSGAQRCRKRRKALLRVLHLLLYVGLDEPGNLDAIRLLVRLYVDNMDSFKSDLLSTLKGAVHIQNEHGRNTILVEVFRLIDGVPSVEDRASLLAVVDETMGLKDADKDLLTAYCSLMGVGKRPSTVLLAVNHMNRMITAGVITKESLEAVDFLSVLHPYFVQPKELPFINKLNNINGEEFEMTSKLLLRDNEVMLESESEDELWNVLCQMSIKIWRLVDEYTRGNTAIRNRFGRRNVAWFKALFGLLLFPEIRNDILNVITTVSRCFPSFEQKVVPSLITTLLSVGTAIEGSRTLVFWTRVLEALVPILAHSPESAATSFRLSGGFTWIVSVIGTFRLARDEHRMNVDKALIPPFVIATLHVLRSAIKNSAENVAYLRNDITLETFTETLKTCLSYAYCAAKELFATLFSLAVRGPWHNLVCPHNSNNSSNDHCKTATEIKTGDIITGSLFTARGCKQCAHDMHIEIPEIVQVIATDLLDTLRDLSAQECSNNGNNGAERDMDKPALAVLSVVRELIGLTPHNVEVMSRADTQGCLIAHYGQRLIADAAKGATVPVQLVKLLALVCAHNLTTPHARFLFTAIAQTGFHPAATALLQELADAPPNPSVSLRLGGSCCHSGGGNDEACLLGVQTTLGERPWPPRAFTASLWVRIDRYATQDGWDEEIPLFSMCPAASPPEVYELGAYIKKDVVVFRVGGSKTAFPRARIAEGRWYHVVLSYAPADPAQDQSGRVAVVAHIGTVATGGSTVSLPRSGFLGPVMFTIGAPAPQPHADTSALCVGNACFLEKAGSDLLALLLHALGPSHCGDLMQKFEYFTQPAVPVAPVDMDAPPPSEAIKAYFLKNRALSLENAADGRRLIAFFVARRVAVAEMSFDRCLTPMVPIVSVRDGSGASSEVCWERHIAHSRNIRDTINDFGGVHLLLYMLGTAKTAAQQQSALRLLVTVLRYSVTNCRQMHKICGYKLLARFMCKSRWVLDRGLLELIFALIGVARRRKGADAAEEDCYDAGYIVDLNAIRTIALDWDIWERAPEDIQLALVAGLRSLVTQTPAEMIAFNTRRLMQCAAVPELLYILRRPTVREPLVGEIVALVKAIMMGPIPPVKEDIQAAASFLFATHKVRKVRGDSVRSEGLFASTTPNVVSLSSLSSSSSAAFLSRQPQLEARFAKRLNQSSSGTTSATASPSSSFSKRGDCEDDDYEVDEEKSDPNITQKRIRVLELLHSVLSYATPATREIIVTVLPLEVILSMLQNSDLALRIPLLLLLDLYLKKESMPITPSPSSTPLGFTSPSSSSSPFASQSMTHTDPAQLTSPYKSFMSPTGVILTSPRGGGGGGSFVLDKSATEVYDMFIKLGGFDLLGVQLQSYSASTELYHTLFNLLIGDPFPREGKGEVYVSVYNIWGSAGKVHVTLLCPEVVRTIMMVAAGPLAEYREQHSVVRALQLVCSASEEALHQLMANDLAMSLFRILLARIRRRRHRSSRRRGVMPAGGIGRKIEDSSGNDKSSVSSSSPPPTTPRQSLTMPSPSSLRAASSESTHSSCASLSDITNDYDSNNSYQWSESESDNSSTAYTKTDVSDESDNDDDDDDEIEFSIVDRNGDKSSSSTTTSSSDSEGDTNGDGDENGEGGEESDEDILSFVRTIIFNSTQKDTCTTYLTDFLRVVRSLGFTRRLSYILQMRIVYDLLRFYSESPKFYLSPNMTHNFVQITSVAIDFIKWEMREGDLDIASEKAASSATTMTTSSPTTAPEDQERNIKRQQKKKQKRRGYGYASSSSSSKTLSDPYLPYFRAARVHKRRVVTLLLTLLLRSLRVLSAKDKYNAVMDNAWRLLYYVLTTHGMPRDILLLALESLNTAEELYAAPQIARTTAVMVALTRFFPTGSDKDKDRALIANRAEAAFKKARELGPKPSIMRMVTLTLSLSYLGVGNDNSGGGTGEGKSAQDNLWSASSLAHPSLQDVRSAYINEAALWSREIEARDRRFQDAQERAFVEGEQQIAALRRTVAAQRAAITETAYKFRWDAQSAPALELSRRKQRDAVLTHEAWKTIFHTFTHERGVFALALHHPFRRITLDSTTDTQHQRLRVHWKISDPSVPVLSPPFAASSLTCLRSEALHAIPVKFVPMTPAYGGAYYELLYGHDPEVPDAPTVEVLPIVTSICPVYEDSLAGGHRIVVTGRNFPTSREQNPAFLILLGGLHCEIEEFRSPTELVIVSPPQGAWGYYEVLALHNGRFRYAYNHHVRYGYIQVGLFRDYLAAKDAVPLDHSGDSPQAGSEAPLCLGLPKPTVHRGRTGSSCDDGGSDPGSRSGSTVPSLSTSPIPSSSSPSFSPCSSTSERDAALTPSRSGSCDTENGNGNDADIDSIKFVYKEDYLLTLDCTWVTTYSERQGKVCLNERSVAFFAEGATVGVLRKYSWTFDDICGVHRRRHVLRDVAVELFFDSGKACLFAFAATAQREQFISIIRKAELPNLHDFDTEDKLRGGLLTTSLTDRWARGDISNYEYLMRLNVLAGRTFNDLNQYPVLPWVIADYTSETLDLSDPKTFRDLSKPMGAQSEQRAAKFASKYEQLEEMGEVPYFYGTHYSSSGAVLHYLSRLEPYASYHVAFQSGRFDVPDRLFYDVAATWTLASSSALGDVKELIPEFYTLPEMFDDANNFYFGERQDGSRVYGVLLPPWAGNDPREFVRLNRAALECEYVSAHLHEWIDLIFGCKQQSREALNVFHPYTCEGGVDWDAIEDPVDRLAKQTQVNTWGQTPRKLFAKPHPKRNIRLVRQALAVPMVGTANCVCSSTVVARLTGAVGTVCYSPQGDPVIFAEKTLLMNWSMTSVYLTWGYWDNTLRVVTGAFNVGAATSQVPSTAAAGGGAAPSGNAKAPNTQPPLAPKSAASFADVKKGSGGGDGVDGAGVILTVQTVDPNDDEIITAALSDTGHCLVCGSAAGVVLAWKRHDQRNTIFSGKFTKLFGHTGAVVSAYVSSEHSLIATGSRDGTCILWDANKFAYIRTLRHSRPVTAICMSSASGFIYALEEGDDDETTRKTTLHLWTVNGAHLADVEAPYATALAVTGNSIGFRENIVAVGDEHGAIRFWDANTLKPSTEKTLNKHSAKITALKFS